MLTYQDLLAVADREQDRAEFVRSVISNNEQSGAFHDARIGDDYDRSQNTTTMQYVRMLTTVTGQKVPDRWKATHRSCTNFYGIFTTQLSQYLLSNGVTWKNEQTAETLGDDFDSQLATAGKAALVGGVAFGFWNFDHLEVFPFYSRDGGCFAPLYDEENGGLSAGVRYWQIDSSKPLRATLYELDGYTDYLWDNKHEPSGDWTRIQSGVYAKDKRMYILKTQTSEMDGTEIINGENYPSFPIVPIWGNPHHQADIVGLREKIDAYDFILNGFENDLDNAQIYWIIKGAGGMDDPDLARFLERLHIVGAVAPEDGQDVVPYEVNIPYEARERLLDRLEKQLYKDSMLLNPDDIAAGAATATQIRAAYERQNVKADEFEYCVLDFLRHILALAGVEDTPTFTRSKVVNVQEEITTLVAAAQYLGQEYVTRKILTLLGDGDKAQEVLDAVAGEELERVGLNGG